MRGMLEEPAEGPMDGRVAEPVDPVLASALADEVSVRASAAVIAHDALVEESHRIADPELYFERLLYCLDLLTSLSPEQLEFCAGDWLSAICVSSETALEAQGLDLAADGPGIFFPRKCAEPLWSALGEGIYGRLAYNTDAVDFFVWAAFVAGSWRIDLLEAPVRSIERYRDLATQIPDVADLLDCLDAPLRGPGDIDAVVRQTLGADLA